MVLAAPTDQEVLELQREANHLREELLRDQEQRGNEIELTILNQPGREQLTQALEQGHYQVLHYAGHSNLGVSGGDLYLVSDRTGLTEVLSGDDLAGLLVNNGIRMAVFNSCRGVYTATADPANETESSNLTDALLKRGIPAVLAMAERIPDDVALTLSRLFYRNLKQRYPLDLSLNRARQGLLSAYGSNQLYWALPILYLHPDFDGYLQPEFVAKEENNSKEISNLELSLASFGMDTVAEEEDDDLMDAETMFDGLSFDDQEDEESDSDRQAVIDLLNNLRDPGDNPFSNDTMSPTFFDPSQLELDPDVDENTLYAPEECIALGEMRYAQNDLAGAIAAYGRALKLDPNSSEAYCKMGTTLETLDSPAEAFIAYKMALQLNPELQEAKQNAQRLERIFEDRKAEESRSDAKQVAVLSPPVVQGEQEGELGQTTFPPSSRIFGDHPQKPMPRRRPWIAIGVLGTALAAGLGFVIFKNFPFGLTPEQVTPAGLSTVQDTSSGGKVSEITASATTSFAQGDLRRGQELVEKLLNQNAIQAAEQAIANVPPNQRDNPGISFLLGRIAWQAIQTPENRNYSLDDVRGYWSTAVTGNRTPQYLNALGFVYYAQGDFKDAAQHWNEASELAQQQAKSSPSTKQVSPAKLDELTALAGLALVAGKSAGNQSPQQARFRQTAVELRGAVLRQAPANFQENALAQNWLWTEKAIADWKALLAMK
jgi:tetratricopeptide (TPR) repeat protein